MTYCPPYFCEACGDGTSGILRFCHPCLDSGRADRWLDENESPREVRPTDSAADASDAPSASSGTNS